MVKSREIVSFTMIGSRAVPTNIIIKEKDEFFFYPRLSELDHTRKTEKLIKENIEKYFPINTFLGTVYFEAEFYKNTCSISDGNGGVFHYGRNTNRDFKFINVVFDGYESEVHNHLRLIISEKNIKDIIKAEKERFGESYFESWYLTSLI